MTFAGFQNSHEYPYYSSTLHRYVRTISYLAKFWDHIIVFASFELYILRVNDVSNHFCGYYHRLLRKKKKEDNYQNDSNTNKNYKNSRELERIAAIIVIKTSTK